MKFDYKNILIGAVIGILGTFLVLFVIGDVDIQTDFQFGKKIDQDDKDIRISIERNINKDGKESVNVNATGRGSVTMEDIENELSKFYSEKNIDILSENFEVEVNIRLDENIDLE